MVNLTQISYFTFSAYFESGSLKYIFFVLVMSLYILIVYANPLLVVVICLNRSLHEPMYIFLCSLFVNELYGSTGLFPFLLLQILSDIHTVSASFCFLQVFCVYSYGSVEFANLAIMSYDRYLAVCYPLQYNIRMTTNKVAMLIALSWLSHFLAVVVLISLLVPSQLCGNIINKVYCDNYSIVKLACYDTTVNNIYGVIATLSGSKQTRQKAVSTRTPRIASVLDFSLGCFFEIIQSRFNMKSIPNMMQIFLSLYFLTCQPLFNPVMYGLNMSKIHIICKSLVFVEL